MHPKGPQGSLVHPSETLTFLHLFPVWPNVRGEMGAGRQRSVTNFEPLPLSAPRSSHTPSPHGTSACKVMEIPEILQGTSWIICSSQVLRLGLDAATWNLEIVLFISSFHFSLLFCSPYRFLCIFNSLPFFFHYLLA